MKIKLVQDSIIFISEIDADTFAKVNKFVPEALTLYHEGENKKKTPVCSLGYADCGGVNKNGIIFDATTDSGKLCLTIVNAEGFDPHLTTVEKLRQISEKYSTLVLNMNELEAQIISWLEAKEDEINMASASISAITIEDNDACEACDVVSDPDCNTVG